MPWARAVGLLPGGKGELEGAAAAQAYCNSADSTRATATGAREGGSVNA